MAGGTTCSARWASTVRSGNLYWDRTKGEMTAGCREPALLKKLAVDSLSCSSPTRGDGRAASSICGYCLPCLIRRASLMVAWGAGNDATTTPFRICMPSRWTPASRKGEASQVLPVRDRAVEASLSSQNLLIPQAGLSLTKLRTSMSLPTFTVAAWVRWHG